MILDSDAVIGFLDRGDSLHASADSTVRKLILEPAETSGEVDLIVTGDRAAKAADLGCQVELLS